MRMATIASGSSGNCTYIGTRDTHILIDAGISLKRITEGLQKLDLTPDEIDAVFITHEHTDHISALPMIAKHFGLPVYATAGTAGGIRKADTAGVIDPSCIHVLDCTEEIRVGDLTVRPFPIPHDAAEPVAYRVEKRSADRTKSVAVATDLGCYDDRILSMLTGLDAMVLEANHDVRMLQVGPYPYRLKQRILSDSGHLSNDMAGELLCRILHDDLKAVLLGHLSDKNNLPELAYETVRVEVELSPLPYHGDDFAIEVAPRYELSRIIDL